MIIGQKTPTIQVSNSISISFICPKPTWDIRLASTPACVQYKSASILIINTDDHRQKKTTIQASNSIWISFNCPNPAWDIRLASTIASVQYKLASILIINPDDPRAEHPNNARE